MTRARRPRPSGVRIAQNLAARLSRAQLRGFLRSLADPGQTNAAIGKRWCLSPQRIGQLRAALFRRQVRLILRPEVAAALRMETREHDDAT